MTTHSFVILKKWGLETVFPLGKYTTNYVLLTWDPTAQNKGNYQKILEETENWTFDPRLRNMFLDSISQIKLKHAYFICYGFSDIIQKCLKEFVFKIDGQMFVNYHISVLSPRLLAALLNILIKI
jgi:hypothetical protein